MRSRRPHVRYLLVAWAVVQFAAGPCLAQDDPWEQTNRKLFAFQSAVTRHVLGPLARGYGAAPSPLRTALRNFNRNLNEPVVMVNDLLQGHIGQGATTLGRVAINSIFGLLGIIDVAKASGIPPHDNDFGVTLGRWGAGPGPYMFLPLIGPTTVRDAFGSAADLGLNPLTYAHIPDKTALRVTSITMTGIDLLTEAQSELEAVRQTSTDPYATIRSYYLQDREAEITGKPAELGPLPEFDSTPMPTEPTETPPVPAPQPQAFEGPSPAPADAPAPPPGSDSQAGPFY